MDEYTEEHQFERLPTHAFGYEFTEIPEFVRADLDSLEREGVLYADHWVEELNDFRHVRITLTPEEAKDYARRSWAFELFLRAGSPQLARNVPGIDLDVANEADNYTAALGDGTRINPPYHCFAAFLGHRLESISCGMGNRERVTIVELQGKESALFTLKRAVQALTPTIRSFNVREKGLAAWPVVREDDVRDLLYAMLRPTLFDLIKEEPVPSLAGKHKIVDLCSNSARILIEVKWVGKKGYWKEILEQIYTDIQCYPSHPSCETLLFVIIDSARDIPDPRLVENDMSRKQVINGRNINIVVFVTEP